MNRPDAERLLGGYAAGILTAEEKQALFSAALQHQDIFDALMDEEALREILADPVARERLLAVLPDHGLQIAPKLPWWRRPSALGLAASFFLLATTGYMVWRNGRPSISDLESTRQEAAKVHPESDAALQESAKVTPAEPSVSSSPAPKRKVIKPETELRLAPRTQRIAPEEAKEKGELAPPPPVAKPQAASPSFDYSAEAENGVNPNAPAAAGSALTAKKAMPATVTRSKADLHSSHVSSHLERLPDGMARLKVLGAPAHLYLLKRTGSQVDVLAPVETQPGTIIYQFPLGENDMLDLYALEVPVADPASLPASPQISGEWHRIFPE